ncbi:MAG TPA: transporter [Balneolaceae bacterium]|nr:transporter [Balneolaceae bacterium]
MAYLFRVLLFFSFYNFILAIGVSESLIAQRVTYSGSLQYSAGSYFFTDRTESFYVSNGFGIHGDRARISFNVPYVVQSSPWISYGTAGGIPTGGTGHKQVGQHSGGSDNQMVDFQGRGSRRIEVPDTVSYRQSSFSDPSVNGSVRVYTSPNQKTNLTVNASVKLPLSNPASGFGTGAWDAGAGVSLFHRMNTVYLFSDVMYWQMGDMDDLNLKNPFSLSAGAGKVFREGTWMVTASIYGSTEIIETADPPASMNAGVGYFISSGVSLNGTFSFGLSESSPDVSAGVGWSLRL